MPTIHPDPEETHSLELVIRMTNSSRRKIQFYCAKGLISPTKESSRDAWHFDENNLHRLRHIETLRQHHRMNWAAIYMIISMLDELENLRAQLRFQR